MALTSDELDILKKLRTRLSKQRRNDELLLRYYQGRQRVEQLGMAIPPEMRRFLVITNWCRTVVDTTNDRQQVRWLILPGEETADPQLRAIWDANNLSAHTAMFNADRMIFGRAFMSVGTNEDDDELPLVRVESPRQMAAIVDTRRERISAAARFYRRDGDRSDQGRATLYLPDVTVQVERDGGRWIEVDRDEHNLGAVPIVMHLNRRMSGEWVGESQMSDIIPLVDAAARSLTNLQFAQEAHGIPRMWMAGVKKEDFVDEQGKPRPQFEAYFDAIHMLAEASGKVGQISAADLKNFETALTTYRTEASTLTGFPGRFFGLATAGQAPGEGAIRADEAKLIRSVEAQNEQVGMSLGWVGALAMRFATGEWVTGNRVRVEWFDPATPTVAQRMDAITKAVQSGILSREGAWDELGWSEPRKAKERAYFAAQAADPVLQAIADQAGQDALLG